MKKILCTLLVLIASVVSAYATDGITAKSVSIPQGNFATLEIDLTSETNKYGGFQFELKLPAGISVTGIQKSDRLTSVESENDHFNAQIKPIDETNNVYQVLVFIVNSDENHLIDIAGTSGAVAFVTLAADNTVVPSAVLEGQLNNVVLSTVGAEQVNASDSKFSITILDPLSVVTLKETDETAPDASNGAVDVIVLRTINADEWSTICLPFDMNEEQVKDAFGEDVVMATMTGWSFQGTAPNVDKINIVFSTEKTLEKNYPYVIKVKSPITSFVVKNVEIDPENEPTSNIIYSVTVGSGRNQQTINYTGHMYGTYVSGNTYADDLFLADNKFWYSNGKTKIKGFRATFNFGNILISESNASRISMSFEDSTGINEVKVVEDNKFYNLSGQQVKPAKKGLYIQNGKKKIIK